MYAIRVDASRHILNIDLSDRLTTAEALRAVSQAFALADASALPAAICDIRNLRRGPGGLLVVAAAISFRLQPGMRIALVGTAGQEPLVERVIRYTGLTTALQFVESPMEAEAFVEPLLRRGSALLGSTELRHAEELLVAHQPKSSAQAARPRRASATGLPAA
jgi:hypothetical protein